MMKEKLSQIISEIDYLKSFLNNALNRLTMLSCCHKKKIHECLINLLYMKRVLVSDEDRINSQMQEFKYEQVIPNGKIEEFVNAVNDNIAVLYSSSVCNFEKELEQSLNTYAKYPMSYIFSSYNIDSDSQTYLKSEDGFVDSVFMNYYDEKGKIFTFDRHSRRASGGDPISGICVEGYGGPQPGWLDRLKCFVLDPCR